MNGQQVPAEQIADAVLAHEGEPIRVSDIIDGHAPVSIEGKN